MSKNDSYGIVNTKYQQLFPRVGPVTIWNWNKLSPNVRCVIFNSHRLYSCWGHLHNSSKLVIYPKKKIWNHQMICFSLTSKQKQTVHHRERIYQIISKYIDDFISLFFSCAFQKIKWVGQSYVSLYLIKHFSDESYLSAVVYLIMVVRSLNNSDDLIC